MLKLQLWLQYGVDHTMMFNSLRQRPVEVKHRFHLHRLNKVYLVKLALYLWRVNHPRSISKSVRRGWTTLSWSTGDYRFLSRGNSYLTTRRGVQVYTSGVYRLLSRKPLIDYQRVNFTQQSVLAFHSRWETLLSPHA